MQFIVDRVSDPYDLSVYIHQAKLTALSMNDGDTVKIRSRAKKDVIATVRAVKRSSFPVSNIQIGRCLRQNLGCYLGQIVIVESCKECRPADKVLLNPIEDTVSGLSGNFIDVIKSSKYNFADLPIKPDMIFPVYALGHVFEFKVSQCSPTNTVMISNANNLQVNNTPVPRQNNHTDFKSPSYDDIGGMKKAIKDIRRSIELPLLQPQIFQMIGLEPHKGILIQAPHGCGKTFLSRCIRNETPVYFEHIPCLDLIAKAPDETSIILRKLCDRAIAKAPAIVFFDDIDMIAMDQTLANYGTEKRLKYTVLANIDRLLSMPQEKSIVVIATATDAKNVTPELLLSNRLTRQINISRPSRKDRIDIMAKLTRRYTVSPQTNLEELTDMLEAKTGGELQLGIQRLIQLKTMNLLSKIAQTGGKIQLDNLRSIIINKENFEDLIKNFAQQSTEISVPVSNNQTLESSNPFSGKPEVPVSKSPFNSNSNPFANNDKDNNAALPKNSNPFNSGGLAHPTGDSSGNNDDLTSGKSEIGPQKTTPVDPFSNPTKPQPAAPVFKKTTTTPNPSPQNVVKAVKTVKKKKVKGKKKKADSKDKGKDKKKKAEKNAKKKK